MKLFSLILIFLSGCSSVHFADRGVEQNDEQIQKIESQEEYIYVTDNMSESGNKWYLDKHGNFVIVGLVKKDKIQFRNFMFWKVYFDMDMPNMCFGKFASGDKLFEKMKSEIENFKSDYNIQNSECIDEACQREVVAISHTVSYDLYLKSYGNAYELINIYPNHILYDFTGRKNPDSYERLINRVLKLFINSGMDVYDWNPKSNLISEISCNA